MNNEKKTKPHNALRELADWLDAYEEWYNKHYGEGVATTQDDDDSGPNPPTPPPPPIKPGW